MDPVRLCPAIFGTLAAWVRVVAARVGRVGDRLALAAGGELTGRSTPSATVSFRPDPASRPAGTLNVVGSSQVPWRGAATVPMVSGAGAFGSRIRFTATDHDVMVVGPASLDLRLSSSARDTDLQATLSEVRPDGRETM